MKKRAKLRGRVYFGELSDFIVSLEKGLFFQQLPEYAANAPQVDCRTILLGSQQEFGSAVPQGDYQLCELWGRITIISRHAEIRHFHLAAVIHQQI